MNAHPYCDRWFHALRMSCAECESFRELEAEQERLARAMNAVVIDMPVRTCTCAPKFKVGDRVWSAKEQQYGTVTAVQHALDCPRAWPSVGVLGG